jgi:hypothetical protein
MSAELERDPVDTVLPGDRRLEADLLAMRDDLAGGGHLGVGTAQRGAQRIVELAGEVAELRALVAALVHRSERRCEWCGAELPPAKPGQRQRFCSARCRTAAYRARRDALGAHGSIADEVIE